MITHAGSVLVALALSLSGCTADATVPAVDAESFDASPLDRGPRDAAGPDASPPDAAPPDDAGDARDAAPTFDAALDAGPEDGGAADAGPGDSGRPEGAHPDIVRVIDVPGRNPRPGWKDSYSVGDRCYCDSTFDHGVGDIVVDTPRGRRTVREVCELVGPGPGASGRPVYNDIQCGNGPPNDAGDEDDCPGRVDIGREGCGHIGPTWKL